MKTFKIVVTSPKAQYANTDVVSFRGSDASGSFGILAGRAPLLTVLSMGLVELTLKEGARYFLAMPGGLLRFEDNQLCLITDFFIASNHAEGLLEELRQVMQQQQERQQQMQAFIRNIDQELVKRLHKSESLS